MSNAITLTPALSPQGRGGEQHGFTLIELVVVLMILGMMAAVIIPRVASFSAGDLQRVSRRLSGGIQHLTQESAATKKTYRLYFNLDSNEYWTAILRGSGEVVTVKEDNTITRRTLPDGIEFEDVVTVQHGKVIDGEVFATFHPVGVEAMTIHLKQQATQEGGLDQHYTLQVNPLTGRVTVSDSYLDTYEKQGLYTH